MHPEIEKLIEMALSDGQVTDKECEIILRKAEKLGLDRDEVEMYLEGRLDSKKQDNSSKLIERASVNLESKTLKSVSPSVRNFTPREVIQIKPAQLNKENELKLKISELSDSKKVLLHNLENLYNNLKIPHDYLVSQKIIVDKQLKIFQDEFIKTSKIYVDKFINEINISVSEKFGSTALIISNPERFIGLGTDEIVNFIKDEGTWEISSLKIKYGKSSFLYKIIGFAAILFAYFIGRGNLSDAEEWIIGILIIIALVCLNKSSNYSKLIKKNKMNFSSDDISSIIQKINSDNFKEVEKLILLKNQMNRFEILLKDLEIIKSYRNK